MVELKQPQKNIDQEMMREQAVLAEIMSAKRWEDLTREQFPLMAEIQARPFYFTRLGLINEEMRIISEAAELDSPTEGSALAILRGRLQELGEAASETIKLLYPNVKPVNEESFLSVEELRTIEEFVQLGVVERLTDELPGWKDLEPERRLLYRLEALQIFYSSWQHREDDDSLNEINPVGFKTAGIENGISRIKKTVQVAQEKIITRHLDEWLKEADAAGLGEDNEMVKAARKLQENKPL